ncbi:histidine phosphatase family protein [Sporolactobacillus sp. THM7-7]|nr:histidine phosphatase family protein [Sporolactobacillus sp. THM7-7]
MSCSSTTSINQALIKVVTVMANIYLLRHGETEWNQSGNRYCGRTDIPLSSAGKRQAERAALFLKHVSFSGAYSSTLKRAYDTACIIAERHHLPVKQEERIIEADFGRWEGKKKSVFIRENPEAWKKWAAEPETYRAGEIGETAADIFRRAKNFYEQLATEFQNGQNILVVSHNTVNRIFLAGILGMPFKNYRYIAQSNTGINVIRLDEANPPLIRQINVCEHLAGNQ